MHNEEHRLPLVANSWCKTGYNCFESKEDNVNHADDENNNNGSEYNKAEALVKKINFSDNEEGNSGEEDKEEDN